MSAHALPGWFGKLPGMGDFAHRRLPDSFRSVWDAWLQRGMARLRDRHADWTAHYLEAPVWCFALGPGVAGDAAWIGVMMPSVDGVGRYFPFTLAGAAWGDAVQWWGLATRAALEGLEDDLDPERFDAVLGREFASAAAETGAPVVLPGHGESVWMTDPGDGPSARMVVRGLPSGEQFEALFLGGGE
ncbi:type VI secretion system protein ImpM [Variovorax sp. TBS-050B]|uniref:type VI secretion system-associated protein TagF n=1 Tax=Variovorax sp. TBS-050B TaxID=2940551 RepID=UPI002473E8EE|nr:type VI secretion system-associated protein TagF [Variovorax sp. TBS-050B]MDH6592554.1 type VI secretion system protein ImpM [Variovorax sp. TBS-050B]